MTKYETTLAALNEGLLPIKALTELYNELTGEQLKKFENKAKGEKRVRPLLETKIAEEALSSVKKPVAEKIVKVKTPTDVKDRKVSISGKCQELILAGLADAEILEELRKLNLLTDEKKQKSYPAWNRATMKRKGQI